MKQWLSPVATLVLACWPTVSVAQGSVAEERALLERMVDCAGTEQETLRLQCYDSVIQPLAERPTAASSEAESVILSFAGSDDHDTDLLTIRQSWRVRWMLDGSILSIELRSDDGSLIDMVGNQIGGGQGRSELLQPGVYWLAVRAIGDWQVVLEAE